MKIILVSHGSFSKGLAESAQMIMGEQEKFVAHGLYPQEAVTALKDRLEQEIKNTEIGDEILILTDLFHGSPFNAVVELMGQYDLYHVTGINLPLVMEAIIERYSGSVAKEICDNLVETAPDTVKDVRAMLEEEEEE